MNSDQSIDQPTPPEGFRLVSRGEAYSGSGVLVKYDDEPWRKWSFPTLWPTDTLQENDNVRVTFCVPVEQS